MKPSELQSVKQRFGMIGNADALNRAIDVAVQVAPTDLSVLITGESGEVKKIFLKLYIITAIGSMGLILLSTVGPFRKEPSTQNFLVMKKVRSRVQLPIEKGILKWPTEVLFFWMK